MNILIVGINGKMGQNLKNVAENNNHKIIAGIDVKPDLKNNIFNNFNLPKSIIEQIDIVIDFALPNALKDELDFCTRHNKKLIICSTGHSKEQLTLIEKACKKIPIFKTTNTSLGIAFILKILTDNLGILNEYDIGILEKHHLQKKDAPSGTAKSILQALSPLKKDVFCHSIRAGNVAGEHEIMLFFGEEQIYIKHIAQSRKLFAQGAVKIINFMQTQNQKKLYNMQDLLHFKLSQKN